MAIETSGLRTAPRHTQGGIDVPDVPRLQECLTDQRQVSPVVRPRHGEEVMEAHTILWRRHDIPGHEACRLVSLGAGWQLAGVVVLAYEGQACRLDYMITCDAQWLTHSATVTGWVGERTIDVQVGRDAAGRWQLNGRAGDELTGCHDIDLNFSPATNLLPIRRLGLAVGDSAQVRAAWLQFPSCALEPLDQTYTCVEPRLYRYESGAGRFVASVRVDEVGFVIEYGDIWSREVAT